MSPFGRLATLDVCAAAAAFELRSSNQVPQTYQTKKGAYGSLFGLARPERFELPTNWFEASYSIQLSYGRVGVDYIDISLYRHCLNPSRCPCCSNKSTDPVSYLSWKKGITMTDTMAAPDTEKAATQEELFTAHPWPLLRKVLEIAGWVLVALLLYTGVTSIIGRAFFLNEFLPQEMADPAAVLNPFDIRYYEHAIATILHLIPALIIFGLGPLQFIRPIRKRYLKFHRWCGRLYIVAGLIAAATGFFLGVFYPFMGLQGQGFNEAMAVMVLSVYVLICLVKAYTTIRARQFAAHREWMIRSFALMLGVATQRVFVALLMASTDVGIQVLFGTAAWMALAVQVAAMELWINLTRTPGNGNRHWKDLDARA